MVNSKFKLRILTGGEDDIGGHILNDIFWVKAAENALLELIEVAS